MVDTTLSGAAEIVEAALQKDFRRLKKWADGHLKNFCQVLPLGQRNSSYGSRLATGCLENSSAGKKRPGGPGGQHAEEDSAVFSCKNNSIFHRISKYIASRLREGIFPPLFSI